MDEPKRYDCDYTGKGDTIDMIERACGEYVRIDDPAIQRWSRIAAWAASNGLLGPDGEPRKIIGTLPVTADGCVMGQGAMIYFTKPNQRWSQPVKVDWYEWGFAEEVEAGQCYSTRSAAEAAAKGGSDG